MDPQIIPNYEWLSPLQIFFIIFITNLIIGLILLIIRLLVTRWWAKRKGWSDSWKLAITVNIFWFIIPFLSTVFLSSYYQFIISILVLIVNILIGTLLVLKLYKQTFKDSFVFVIVILILMFLIGFVIGAAIGVIVVLLLLGVF